MVQIHGTELGKYKREDNKLVITCNNWCFKVKKGVVYELYVENQLYI